MLTWKICWGLVMCRQRSESFCCGSGLESLCCGLVHSDVAKMTGAGTP